MASGFDFSSHWHLDRASEETSAVGKEERKKREEIAKSEEDDGEASSLGRPQEMEQRLAELEGSLGDIQESLRRLVAREPQKQVAPTSKAAARKPALKASAGDNFGVDPTVVRSARQAGIPEEQLRKLGALMGKSTGMADLPRQPRDGRRKTNVLSETEEEEAPPEEELAEEEVQGVEPVERAVLQLTCIDKLAKQKKPRDLDAMLDGLDGGGDGGEGSSSSGGKSKAAVFKRLKACLKDNPKYFTQTIEDLMAEDFHQIQGAPVSQGREVSTEHGWSIVQRSCATPPRSGLRGCWGAYTTACDEELGKKPGLGLV